MSSLISKLKGLGLKIRVGNGEPPPTLASTIEDDVVHRIEMGLRGIVLQCELEENSIIPLKPGQCWMVGDRLLEVLAFRKEYIEYMEWETESIFFFLKTTKLVYITSR